MSINVRLVYHCVFLFESIHEIIPEEHESNSLTAVSYVELCSES